MVKFKKNEKKFFLIDHSHVFKNETIWDWRCFTNGIHEEDIYDNYILTSNKNLYTMFYQCLDFDIEKLYKYCDIFKQSLSYDIISNIIVNVPHQWGVNKQDFEALIEYLLYRLANIEKICDMICDYIKNN